MILLLADKTKEKTFKVEKLLEALVYKEFRTNKRTKKCKLLK